MYLFEMRETITQKDNDLNFVQMIKEVLLPIIPSPGTVLYLSHLDGTEFTVDHLEIMTPDEDNYEEEEEDWYSFILHGKIEFGPEYNFEERLKDYVKYNRNGWAMERFD
jgi:hypothetical protein